MVESGMETRHVARATTASTEIVAADRPTHHDTSRDRPPRRPPAWTGPSKSSSFRSSDLAARIAFYRDQVGFDLDHHTVNEHMDVAQLTPRGSGCSIVIGNLPARTRWHPARCAGVQLVVADAAAARDELVERGVECSELTVFDDADGGTFFGFADPDGNTWAVQQLKVRADKPLIPLEARGRFGAE